jgi:uncharacterized membrane protein
MHNFICGSQCRLAVIMCFGVIVAYFAQYFIVDALLSLVVIRVFQSFNINTSTCTSKSDRQMMCPLMVTF